MSAQCVVLTQIENLDRHIGGDHMTRSAGFVLGIVVIPPIRDDVGHPERPVAHDGCGQLAARHIGLDHHVVGHVGAQLRWAVRVLEHQIDADAGPFVVGLDHIGRRHHMACAHVTGRYDHAVDHRQTGGAVHVLGALFVHGQRRGQHTGMRIGHPNPFQQTLNAAVFAPTAMQAVQDGIRFDGVQNGNEVGACIDLNHSVSLVPQRRCAGSPA